MMQEYIDTLETIPDEKFLALKDRLESEGYFFDEHDDVVFSSVLMENCSKEIEQRLRALGYDGGELQCVVRHNQNYGNVYSLFDTARIDVEEVWKKIDVWITAKI
jgi:hypothetical protein